MYVSMYLYTGHHVRHLRHTVGDDRRHHATNAQLATPTSLLRPQFASPRHLRRLSHRHGSLEQGKTPLGRLSYQVPNLGQIPV